MLEGESSLDVSGLTGEPLPQPVQPGAELGAGCLNLLGPLLLEVRRPGSESAVARIVQLVERAMARKAPIQGLADRVAGRFTLVVLALALATFLFWWQWGTDLWPEVLQPAGAQGAVHAVHGSHGLLGAGASTPLSLALELAIAVLVVACPCALGLATPTAIAVGTGVAARQGLLFRGGDAIETASRLRTILFDKTGTLTRGRPLVRAVVALAAGAPCSRSPGRARCASGHGRAAAAVGGQSRGQHAPPPGLCAAAAGRGAPGAPAAAAERPHQGRRRCGGGDRGRQLPARAARLGAARGE